MICNITAVLQSLMEEKHNYIPTLELLRKHRVKLSDSERQHIIDAGAVWDRSQDYATPGIWKSEIGSKVYWVSNTHRTYRVAKSLSQAIEDFEWVRSTS